MIAKEMEKILAFDCKYAERVEKRTHRRLLDIIRYNFVRKLFSFQVKEYC